MSRLFKYFFSGYDKSRYYEHIKLNIYIGKYYTMRKHFFKVYEDVMIIIDGKLTDIFQSKKLIISNH